MHFSSLSIVTQGEIDAHEDNFKACAEEGQELLDDEHPASDEVKEKVQLLMISSETYLIVFNSIWNVSPNYLSYWH